MDKIQFEELGLSPEILKALKKRGITEPTRVQREAIPPLMKKKDVIAKAPTGTGKTFAFGIPLIEHIDLENEGIQALVLAPTRELVIQISSELRMLLAYKKDIRLTSVYGGQRMDIQLKNLKRKPQIIVATPGRLLDHMKRRTLNLSSVKTLILDEADRMLDMGFIAEVTRIIERTKNRENLALFSATMSSEVMTISWKYQRDEVEITVPPDEQNKPDITQYAIEANSFEKMAALYKILKLHKDGKAIIFCNTKYMVSRICEEMKGQGYLADELQGDIRQSLREKVMSDFKSDKINILVATDVASRGIDVLDVDCVINYEIPEENEYYIHRIGRTGRAKSSGVAYSLIGNINEKVKLDEITKYSDFKVAFMRFTAEGKLEPVPKRAPRRRSTRRF